MPFPRRSFAPLLALACATSALAGVTVKELPDRVRIEIDGELFTELRHGDATRPYLWPVIGPRGAKMTRAWPMAAVEGEDRDHPHHRSIWFSHGLVNGVDFWTEPATHGTKTPKHPVGKIVVDKVVEAKGSADKGVVATATKWLAPDGTALLNGVERLTVWQTPASERQCDFELTLTAGEKDVVFGDTKEGTFAIRIAESMRTKQPKGKASEGHILNSAGQQDEKVWGQKAKWVDMFGPIEGKTYGIALFDHPKNPRHPTRWHARDYGLFAANPFCEVDMDKAQPKGAGDFALKAGQSVTFKYRLLIHEGPAEAAKLDERFSAYAQSVP